MITESFTHNGSTVNLVNSGKDCDWRSDTPIRCSFCRGYSPLLHHYQFEGESLVVCFSKKPKCIARIMDRLRAYDSVMVRSLRCPENTQVTRKAERSQMNYKLRWEILKRDGFKCVCCGGNDRLEVDHVIPVSKGGKTIHTNLQTLCFPCNRGKSDE